MKVFEVSVPDLPLFQIVTSQKRKNTQ